MTEAWKKPDILLQFEHATNLVYTKLITDVIKPQILDIYNHMVDNHGVGVEVWYGDADTYVKVLPETKEGLHPLLIRNVVTCFDKNYVVCLIDKDCEDVILSKCFDPIQKKSDYDFNLGDWRDYDAIGFDLYKSLGFRYGYEDIRDADLAFKNSLTKGQYNGLVTPRVWDGVRFLEQNLLFVEQEIRHTWHFIVKDGNYTKKW